MNYLWCVPLVGIAFLHITKKVSAIWHLFMLVATCALVAGKIFELTSRVRIVNSMVLPIVGTLATIFILVQLHYYMPREEPRKTVSD